MFNQIQIDTIDDIIKASLIEAGLDHIILIEMAGNIIAEYSTGENYLDSIAFAALAAGDFAALDVIASLLVVEISDQAGRGWEVLQPRWKGEKQ